MLVPLAAAVALLAAFVYVEARVAQAPLVPLSIFRLSALRAANIVVVLMYAALFSMFFFVTLYLQQVLGDDALEAGLSFLPIDAVGVHRLVAGAAAGRAVRACAGW